MRFANSVSFANTVSFLCILFVALVSVANAQTKFKKLPPDGIEVKDDDRARLTERLEEVDEQLRVAKAGSRDPDAWSPDVEVFLRAVDLALTQNLFFKEREIKHADTLLDVAENRIRVAISGKRGLELMGYNANANADPQTLVGGFVSKIDQSVQPFGLVVPSGFKLTDDTPKRLDVWLHGRGDTKTEIPFLTERMTKVGEYAPRDTLVLHPFGRHCNAFKFAGETDVYESMQHVQNLTPVARDRIAIRGFSMGGAGCWHLAVHDPTRWFAANPGAGFVDTIVYQGWVGNLPFDMDRTQKKLMRWYDVLPWTSNLKNTSLIGYSGEKDKQRQAAERVYKTSQELDIQWPHVIGAGMGHKIDEPSKEIIEDQLAKWNEAQLTAEKPRREIRFETYTVRYGRAAWLKVTGLKQQWELGKIDATIDEQDVVRIKTSDITHFGLDFADSEWNGDKALNLDIDAMKVRIDDQDKQRPGFQCDFVFDKEWTIDGNPQAVRKRPGLCGPIDDAFCDRFLFVLPSRPATHGVVERWIQRELKYAQRRWQRLMRGKINVALDRDVTDQQIQNCHLICFGDYSSNRLLARVRSELPIEWTREEIKLGDQVFNPNTHAPIFCYPNPLNPDRYLVVNSGMTFREFSNVSNSRQIAMQPDWAVLNVQQNDDSIFAGKAVARGFFDENWKLK